MDVQPSGSRATARRFVGDLLRVSGPGQRKGPSSSARDLALRVFEAAVCAAAAEVASSDLVVTRNGMDYASRR